MSKQDLQINVKNDLFLLMKMCYLSPNFITEKLNSK